jgi:hypothetical protein
VMTPRLGGGGVWTPNSAGRGNGVVWLDTPSRAWNPPHAPIFSALRSRSGTEQEGLMIAHQKPEVSKTSQWMTVHMDIEP